MHALELNIFFLTQPSQAQNLISVDYLKHVSFAI